MLLAEGPRAFVCFDSTAKLTVPVGGLKTSRCTGCDQTCHKSTQDSFRDRDFGCKIPFVYSATSLATAFRTPRFQVAFVYFCNKFGHCLPYTAILGKFWPEEIFGSCDWRKFLRDN